MKLFLHNSEKDKIFYQGNLPDGFELDTIFRNGTVFEKAIQRIWFKKKLPFYKKISFNKWITKEYDVIIVEVLRSKKELILLLQEMFPNTKIILWYWNTVESSGVRVYPEEIKGENCECWSFDKNDCEKYGLKYNSQFYNKEIKISGADCDVDVVFVGGDKGRGNILSTIKRELDKRGIKTDFHITKAGEITNCDIEYKETISYQALLDKVAHSKAILDVGIGGQVGLTLRVMEALFFEKKLITTNEDLRNYDFYNENNIYILKDDNYDELVDFLYRPYTKIDSKIIEYYEFRNWLERFVSD